MYDKILVRNTTTGATYEAIEIGRANDMSCLGRAGVRPVCDPKNTYCGAWIDGIGRVEMKSRDNPTSEWENTNSPFDKNDQLIKPGDTIYYAMRSLEVSKMVITSITHNGGHRSTMYGTDVFTGKKTRNSYPYRCLKA